MELNDDTGGREEGREDKEKGEHDTEPVAEGTARMTRILEVAADRRQQRRALLVAE